MSVGANIAPGWPGVYSGNIPKMNACLDALKPDSIRMPWVNNVNTINTWLRCVSKGIDVILEDDINQTPMAVMQEIAEAATANGITAHTYIQGLNEPFAPSNGGSAVSYTADQITSLSQRQSDLYAAVKAFDPSWQVLSMPAYSGAYGVNGTNKHYINDDATIAMACDIANVHRYFDMWGAAPDRPSAVLPVTDKPIWVTETGCPTARKWIIPGLWYRWLQTEAQQAQWLPEFIGWLVGNGAARVQVYCLEDDGPSITNPENNMGLFRRDGSAKPVVAALHG